MVAAVIDPRAVGWVLGSFILALAATMLVPLGYGLLTGGGDLGAISEAIGITAASGSLLLILSRARPRRDLKQREGILLVVLVWGATCLFGSLPFYFSPYFAGFTDALFEAASGFTTTGATVLARVEVLSEPIQFWRCFTHWIGGLGIVLLGVAILPLIGQGGLYLYRAEFSGAKSEKLAPRVLETARALWKVYLVLTLTLFVALRLLGMTDFEALCHAFSTLGTGGFSTRTDSITGFASPAIEYTLVVFMLLGGMSFVLHFRWFSERQPLSLWRDYELRWYLVIALAASLAIGGALVLYEGFPAEKAARESLFQVVSVMTTTGFVTADFAAWFPLCPLILLTLMFVGGCTGSTAGGLKVARVVLLASVVDREFRRMSEPQGVFAVRFGGETVPETTIHGLLNLVYLAWLLYIIASLLLAAAGVDVLTAISAVAACMFNVGPGLAGVGPMASYGPLPDFAKWVLSGCMVAGRLEFYTSIVILTSTFWRR